MTDTINIPEKVKTYNNSFTSVYIYPKDIENMLRYNRFYFENIGKKLKVEFVRCQITPMILNIIRKLCNTTFKADILEFDRCSIVGFKDINSLFEYFNESKSLYLISESRIFFRNEIFRDFRKLTIVNTSIKNMFIQVSGIGGHLTIKDFVNFKSLKSLTFVLEEHPTYIYKDIEVLEEDVNPNLESVTLSLPYDENVYELKGVSESNYLNYFFNNNSEQMNTVTDLELSGFKISNCCLSYFLNDFTNLKALELNFCKLLGNHKRKIVFDDNKQFLESLIISGSRFSRRYKVSLNLNNLPALSLLDISDYSRNLSDFSKKCSLQSLDLTKNLLLKKLTIYNANALKELDLRNNTLLEKVYLHGLTDLENLHCNQPEVVDVQYCYSLKEYIKQ